MIIINRSKRVFLLLICMSLIVSACSIKLKHIRGYESKMVLDFTKYTEQGFLITPFKYLGDYESIGIITVKVMPEANFISKKIMKAKYPASSADEYDLEEWWEIEDINSEMVIDILYESAVEMGADAIVEFDIEVINQRYGYGIAANPVTLYGYEMSGYAIKRLGAFKASLTE